MRPTAAQVVKLAASQVGYKAPGPGRRNKYGVWIHNHFPTFYNFNKSNCDWCDVFCDYCVLKIANNAKDAEYITCQPARSCGAGVDWSWKYFKAKKRTSGTAHYGDYVFLNKLKHVGIVIKVESKYVTYVAGNEGGGHGQVKKHRVLRSSKSIYGYGRPRYK